MWREEKIQYPAVLAAATAALFHIKELFSFLSTQQFAGRDLASNYAFTWLMQQNLIQGEIFRWSNQWLMGFPSFEMYPPLFFMFTSGLNLVSGGLIGLHGIFRIVVFLSVFLVPPATYYFTKEVFGRERSFFAALHTLLFIFVYPPVSQAYQVFSTGLVAQGFAFILLIPSIGFMLRRERKYRIASGIILGLSALSHPFVATAGFLVSGSMIVIDKNIYNSVPGLIGGLIFLPWFLTAVSHLQYVDTYTFAAANTGLFLYMLLPLIIFGGLKDDNTQPLLISFFILLGMSVIELPILTQELRFYTYALGFGSILAGLGSYRIYTHLKENINLDKSHIFILLMVPVVGLSLQAELPQSWSHEGSTEQLFSQLHSMERGRVMVETSNTSIHDSYVIQANLPLKTEHWAVNDVHLDSSTSANYILTLESWISQEELYNPICRTCNTSASPELTSERLDNLGIRYITVRTENSKNLMEHVAELEGRYGDYWLFENKEDYQIVEKLKYRPVALNGSYHKWEKVNDALFHSSFKGEVIWARDEKTSNYSDTVNMKRKSVEDIKEVIQHTELKKTSEGELSYNISEDEIQVSSSVPVKVKTSYFPSKHGEAKAGTFNTVILTSSILNTANEYQVTS